MYDDKIGFGHVVLLYVSKITGTGEEPLPKRYGSSLITQLSTMIKGNGFFGWIVMGAPIPMKTSWGHGNVRIIIVGLA